MHQYVDVIAGVGYKNTEWLLRFHNELCKYVDEVLFCIDSYTLVTDH